MFSVYSLSDILPQSSLTRPLRVMMMVWVVSAACALPVGLQFGLVYAYRRGEPVEQSVRCNTLDPHQAKLVFQVTR